MFVEKKQGRRSAPGEHRLALFDEGPHALLAVCAVDDHRGRIALVFQARVEVGLQAAVDGALGESDRQRRVFGDALRDAMAAGISSACGSTRLTMP